MLNGIHDMTTGPAISNLLSGSLVRDAYGQNVPLFMHSCHKSDTAGGADTGVEYIGMGTWSFVGDAPQLVGTDKTVDYIQREQRLWLSRACSRDAWVALSPKGWGSYKRIVSEYGLYAFAPIQAGFYSQFEYAARELQRDWCSRRAWIGYYHPFSGIDGEKVCTLGIGFELTPHTQRLNVTMIMRSLDVVHGLPSDFAWAWTLGEMMRVRLGLEGWTQRVTVTGINTHVYKRANTFDVDRLHVRSFAHLYDNKALPDSVGVSTQCEAHKCYARIEKVFPAIAPSCIAGHITLMSWYDTLLRESVSLYPARAEDC